MASKRKVSFHTLGCKLNFSESSALARQFVAGGFERATSSSGADICVINSCTVTAQADKKCRNLIRKIARTNPGAIIAVTGCYAQLNPEAVAAIEGVDIVLGNKSKQELYDRVAALSGKGSAGIYSCAAEELTGFFAAFSSGDRTRSFLKVQDGCDYKCAYCAIPYARGASRNIPAREVVAQAREIARGGQREIVLTGINTGDFGHTTGERFIDLLRELDRVEGIDRYRISSIEPNLLTDEIISFTASSDKFMPHFHIPLQSGCDAVLARMRRRYTTEQFAARIERVRDLVPRAFVGIDLIAGFPGESAGDFEATVEFLRRIAPAYLHVFPYSIREGTPAAGFEDQVSHEEKARRVQVINDLCAELYRDFCSAALGSTAGVLFESTQRGGMMCGFTDNYIKVEAPYDRSRVGRVGRVKLESLTPEGNIRGSVLE